jgi:hypothetical protein
MYIGPTYHKLSAFLKKYIMMERNDVIDITAIKMENLGIWTKKNVWTIEVVCDDDSDRSESDEKSMRDFFHRLMSVYGEEVDVVLVKRIYIVKKQIVLTNKG